MFIKSYETHIKLRLGSSSKLQQKVRKNTAKLTETEAIWLSVVASL